jgi:hypothetical protein
VLTDGNRVTSSDFGGAAHIDEIGEFNGPVVLLHFLSGEHPTTTTTRPPPTALAAFGTAALECAFRATPVAVPNLIGLSTAAARNTIMLAGLKVGARQFRHPGRPQRPGHLPNPTTFGGRIARGDLVNFEYSVARLGSGYPVGGLILD